MCDRMQIFNSDELNLIHHSSMEILKDAGVRFIAEAALEIFRHHGFKTDGSRVFFTEKNISKALEMVPSHFTIRARNTDNNISIGESTDDIALCTPAMAHMARVPSGVGHRTNRSERK